MERCAVVVFMCALFVGGIAAPPACAQSKQGKQRRQASVARDNKQAASAAKRFTARVDAALGAAPAGKGEWGLLIADAGTGETLYELNADKYFVPASNMKLFTTALALTKLGPDYRFHTT